MSFAGRRPASVRSLPEAQQQIANLPASPFPAGYVLEEAGDIEIERLWRFFRDAVAGGEVVWIEASLVDLISAAAESVPLDFVLDETMFPFVRCLAVFAAPIGQCGIGVDGLMWAPVAEGVLIGPFDWDAIPIPAMPCHWRWGETLSAAVERFSTFAKLGELMDEHVLRTATLLAASLLLMTQPGITSVSDAHADRAASRRLVRKGWRVPVVRVVRLRGHEGSGSGASGERHLSRRFIVRGHWRNQPYGPGSSLRRPTWIAPHIKGPEGAPLDTRPTAYLATGGVHQAFTD